MNEKSEPTWALVCNYLMMAVLVVGTVYYLLGFGIVESFLAIVCSILALAIHRRLSFGYFALAAFSFGLFWLAKTGQPFAGPKGPVMALGLILMILALVVHEQLAKRPESGLPEDLMDEDEPKP